jgi:hypothetical protein
MNIWAFLLGFILGVFPVTLALRFFRDKKFLFVANHYIKGALFGFLLWIVINAFLYVEVRYDMIGLTAMEEGFGTIVMFTSSLHGFITAGLVAAFISLHLWKSRA